MPLQNRVFPTGDIVADAARGSLTGNRGILHDDAQKLGSARWRHPHWISCLLAFRGRRRQVMAPGRWTELFFLDEAVACAAGHRPCAECRRGAFAAFQAAWARATGTPARAPDIDRALHAARITRDRRQVRHTAPCTDLPPGTFILIADRPHLVTGAGLHPWAPGGYAPAVPRVAATVTVLTPAPMVATFRAGYAPILHPSAGPNT